MIDLRTEHLLPLTGVPAYLASRGFKARGGGMVSLATVESWVKRGLLEATARKIGGVRHTSEEALARMFAGRKDKERPAARKQPKPRTPKQEREGHDKAMAALEADGYLRN